jgi:hypothetical protein
MGEVRKPNIRATSEIAIAFATTKANNWLAEHHENLPKKFLKFPFAFKST